MLREASYEYDALGNRIAKSVDMDGVGAGVAADQRYVLDGWNPAKLPSPSGRGAGGEGPIGTENFDAWGEFSAGGTLTSRNIHGDEIDQLLARLDGATPYWLLHDHQHSTRTVLDGAGVIKDTIQYDAFGNILSETAPAFGGRYKWTGRELDVETGLQYNRARYYDATTGRWISQDPLGFDAGDSNLYRYINNSPTQGRDPSGMYLFSTMNPSTGGNGTIHLPFKGLQIALIMYLD